MKMKHDLNAFWELHPAYSVLPRSQGQQDKSNDDQDGDVYDHDDNFDEDDSDDPDIYPPGQSSSRREQAAERDQVKEVQHKTAKILQTKMKEINQVAAKS